MKKVVNIVYFMGNIFLVFASTIKKLVPAYNSMVEANKRDKFYQDVDTEAQAAVNRLLTESKEEAK